DVTERKEAREALKKAQEAEIKQLRGFLPICSYCKKIRDDEGYWNQVEKYVSDHTEAKFSHGICPTCFEREMKGIDETPA
ncbi:MAG: sensor with HAMP domain protein, partial [Deltaproteobacteria bacterium]